MLSVGDDIFLDNHFLLSRKRDQIDSTLDSKLEFQEKLACLKEEGIPDECLSFLNLEVGHEKCQEKLNEQPIAELEMASNKCIGKNTGG